MGFRYVNPENPSLIFRKEIIEKHGSSIYAILETHLINDEKLVIDGYEWYGHNRRDISTKAWSGSGGVGFLVKKELLQKYGGLLRDTLPIIGPKAKLLIPVHLPDFCTAALTQHLLKLQAY